MLRVFPKTAIHLNYYTDLEYNTGFKTKQMTDSRNSGGKSQKSETDVARRPRGRPKDDSLRKRILKCATRFFLEHGYQAVAMDAIADAAGVSNRTVYSHFESKERLLAAVFRHEAERLRPRFSEQAIRTSSEFQSVLQRFGEQLVGLLTHPTINGLGRVMIEEARRHPGMAREFYAWGPTQTENQLVDFIELGKQQGWLHTADARLAAQQLLALWQGTWHLKQQLDLTKKLSHKKIELHVEASLQLFFKGVGRPSVD